jgi:hypothetical protein
VVHHTSDGATTVSSHDKLRILRLENHGFHVYACYLALAPDTLSIASERVLSEYESRSLARITVPNLLN